MVNHLLGKASEGDAKDFVFPIVDELGMNRTFLYG